MQYCVSQEKDYTQDPYIRKILGNNISPEAILSACLYKKQKDNAPALILPSDIDLGYFSKEQEIRNIKAATESICHRDHKMITDCIDSLDDAPAVQQINGAFTMLMAVTGSEFLLRQMKKSESEILGAIHCINEKTASFIKDAVLHGISVFSYADPSAIPEIIGEKYFYQYSVKATCDLLYRAAPFLSGSLIHLCPGTSFALEKYNMCRFIRRPFTQQSLIHELFDLSSHEDIRFTGHVCLKSENCRENGLHILQNLQYEGG